MEREVMERILQRHGRFLVDQLLDDLNQIELTTSRATVFRTLHEMVRAGLLRRVDPGTYEHDVGR